MIASRGVPRRQDIDPALRKRLAAWTRYLMALHHIPSKRQMADRMGLSGPTVTNVINHEAAVGLDYLVALHTTFHRSADELLDTNPPAKLPDGSVWDTRSPRGPGTK